LTCFYASAAVNWFRIKLNNLRRHASRIKPGLHEAVHVVRINKVIPLKYVIYLSFLLLGCKTRTGPELESSVDAFQLKRIIADTTKSIDAKIEFEEYQVKKLLCSELGIYELENSQDSLELRLWYEPSIWEPHMLYIIKGNDTLWKAIRYIFYQRRNNFETQDYKVWNAYKDPIIDTLKAETLFPAEMSWRNYISILQIDSLWMFPSQSELKGSYGCVDGSGYTVEIKDRIRYKAFHYQCARGIKELHHEKFTELVENIIAPLSLKGMVSHF